MAIPLKVNTTTGQLAQLLAADDLDIDVISQRTAATNMTIGANLGAGDELQLGKVGEMVRVMGDLTVDGAEVVTTSETINGTFTANGNVNLGSGDDTVKLGSTSGDTVNIGGGTDVVNLDSDLVLGAGVVKIGASVTDYLDALWLDAVGSGGPAAAAYDLNASGTNCGAWAIGVDPALIGASSATELMAMLNDLDDAISAGAGTLQATYETGNTIDVTAAEGIIDLANDTNADATTVLKVSRAPTSSTAGLGLDIDLGANTTGTALQINQQGSGDALDVQDGGGTVLQVTGAGQVNVTPTSGQDANITAAGAGVVDIDGAGGVQIDAGGASNVTVAGANLTLSTTTSGDIIGSAAGALTLDCAGVLELNSSGGAISIGNDAVAQNINIGTGGARPLVDIGNASVTELQLTGALIDINAGASGFTLDGGAASTIATSAGNLSLDAAAAELVLDDVGDSGITLSQSTDRTLDQTGSTEVLNGVTSIIGAINALANAVDVDGAVIVEESIENGVTITAGDVVANSSTLGRVTQGNGNANTNSKVVGVSLTTGTGDAGGTVICRFATSGKVTDSGATFTAGAIFLPDGTGRPVNTAPSGTGDAVKRVGWTLSATEYVIDLGPTVVL